jgi:hypothetical protein
MGEAYERLLEKGLEEAHKVEDKSGLEFHKAIDKAREGLAGIVELSEEGATEITEDLKRDLRDAADYLVETGGDFVTWLGFDIELIEDRLRDMFPQAADQTTVELLKLKEAAESRGYHTGAFTGPGTLVCDACGEKLRFHKVGRIPPCPRCKGTSFHRDSG